MDLTQVSEALGLASSAVGLTDKAASTVESIKRLLVSDKPVDAGEADRLLNSLARELTAANVMNVQLSESLRQISQELRRQDEFEREKVRYEMFETVEQDIVFRLSEDAANGEPIHFACPVCMNRDKIISYVSGNGDFKTCQTDRNHVFRFKKSPARSFKTLNRY